MAERWLSVYPRNYLRDGTPVLPSVNEVAAIAKDVVLMGKWRRRLADLGWFMKAFTQSISRRANRDDGCSGTFWEGRFQAVPLLDQAALIAYMAYVDLNPIRAKLADRFGRSAFTSVFVRIRARNPLRVAATIRARELVRARKLLIKAGLNEHAKHAEVGLWLTPLKRYRLGEALAIQTFSADDYVRLLDATGRLLKPGKRRAIPVELAPILARLDLSVHAWLATMLGWRMFAFSSALGHAAARAAEAGKRGLRWIRNRCPSYVAQTASAAA